MAGVGAHTLPSRFYNLRSQRVCASSAPLFTDPLMYTAVPPLHPLLVRLCPPQVFCKSVSCPPRSASVFCGSSSGPPRPASVLCGVCLLSTSVRLSFLRVRLVSAAVLRCLHVHLVSAWARLCFLQVRFVCAASCPPQSASVFCVSALCPLQSAYCPPRVRFGPPLLFVGAPRVRLGPPQLSLPGTKQ